MRLPLYIDPGTGSMLFTILISVIGAAIYSFRMLFIKLRYKFTGGKAEISSQKLPFVIFSDSKRYWSVFEPICRELDRREKDVLYITRSTIWSTSENNGNAFIESPWASVSSDLWDKDNWKFFNENIVLDEHAFPEK